MRKNILLLLVSSVISLGIVVLGLRLFAPGIGIWGWFSGNPAGVDYVGYSGGASGPSYYDFLIEPDANTESRGFLADALIERSRADGSKGFVYDSATWIRGMPFASGRYGENLWHYDALGFRNAYVPNTADVVCIGDSMTWGTHADDDATWPAQLGEKLSAKKHDVEVYSMALGGWGAVQYAYLTDLAVRFKPKVIIVALYIGNDIYESYRIVSENTDGRYKHLLPASAEAIDGTAAEPARGLDPKSLELSWEADVGGVKYGFMPALALQTNDTDTFPQIRIGLEVVENCILEICESARSHDAIPLFTILPTKEFVYLEELKKAQTELPEEYLKLMKYEAANTLRLRNFIEHEAKGVYVDVATSLQKEAATRAVYPAKADGHPSPIGYSVIAQTLSETVETLVDLEADDNLITNASFEEWLDGKPSEWELLGEDINFDRTLEGAKGNYGLLLRAGPSGKFVTIQQNLSQPDTVAGKTVRLSARIKCAEKQKAALSLQWTENGEKKVRVRRNSGYGMWETLIIESVIPAKSKLGSMSVRVGIRPETQNEVIVDDLRLEVIGN